MSLMRKSALAPSVPKQACVENPDCKVIWEQNLDSPGGAVRTAVVVYVHSNNHAADMVRGRRQPSLPHVWSGGGSGRHLPPAGSHSLQAGSAAASNSSPTHLATSNPPVVAITIALAASALTAATAAPQARCRRVPDHERGSLLGEKTQIFLPSCPPPRLETVTTRTQERWECPPPPLALTTQDSVPRRRRHIVGDTAQGEGAKPRLGF